MDSESKAEIKTIDLWTMLLSTIRYSMGRQTYMPSLCIDMCKMYGHYLSNHQKSQIIREIKREVELYEAMNKTLGAECDHKTWKDGYQELSKHWQLSQNE